MRLAKATGALLLALLPVVLASGERPAFADREVLVVVRGSASTAGDASATVDGTIHTEWCEPQLEFGRLTYYFTSTSPSAVLIAHHGSKIASFKVFVDYVFYDLLLADDAGLTSIDLPAAGFTTLELRPQSARPACIQEVSFAAPTGVRYEAMLEPVADAPADALADTTAAKPAAKPVAKPVAKPAAAPLRASVRATVTNDQIAAAPDALRAMRLALEDCDAETLGWWIEFPITIAGTTYRNAAALQQACRLGEVPIVSAEALEVGLSAGQVDLAGRLHIKLDGGVWRFTWHGRQWWLSSVESR